MQAKIQEALETQQVEISDTYGDGRHVSIDVVSPLFEGLSSVKRQRMVYKACHSLQSTIQSIPIRSPHLCVDSTSLGPIQYTTSSTNQLYNKTSVVEPQLCLHARLLHSTLIFISLQYRSLKTRHDVSALLLVFWDIS